MKLSHPLQHRSPCCRRAARLSAVVVTLVTVGYAGYAAHADGSGVPPRPRPGGDVESLVRGRQLHLDC